MPAAALSNAFIWEVVYLSGVELDKSLDGVDGSEGLLEVFMQGSQNPPQGKGGRVKNSCSVACLKFYSQNLSDEILRKEPSCSLHFLAFSPSLRLCHF